MGNDEGRLNSTHYFQITLVTVRTQAHSLFKSPGVHSVSVSTWLVPQSINACVANVQVCFKVSTLVPRQAGSQSAVLESSMHLPLAWLYKVLVGTTAWLHL